MQDGMALAQRTTIEMITLTDSAAEKMRKLLSDGREAKGIRVGIRGGGCSGFQYTLEFETHAGDKDKTFELKGVSLYIDPKSLLYLMGTEINYLDSLGEGGFKFENPSARRTCGCGESFSI